MNDEQTSAAGSASRLSRYSIERRLIGLAITSCVAALGFGCGSDRWARPLNQPVRTQAEGARHAVRSPLEGTGITWAREIASPLRVAPGHLHLPQCAAYERGLMGLAEVVARRQAAGEPALEMSELVVLLRAQGSPHVWPRVWSLEAPELSASSIEEKWRAWLALHPGAGAMRCGVARLRASRDREIVVGVSAEVLADLSPLPSQARLGQWLRLDARLVQPAQGGRVVLLGPRGRPRDAPSRFTRGALHAVFSLDQPGLWQIQTLLDTESGPRPALEAWILVDQEPDPAAALQPAPGETPSGQSGNGSDVVELREALFQMISAARHSEQLPPMRRDARLDALAQAHAEAMWRSGQTVHQAGWGSPSERVLGAGIRARRVGENVARARNVARAHRALWDSPSHRGNLLDPGFDALGLGVFVEVAAPGGLSEQAPRGRGEAEDSGELAVRARVVWVCELFVDEADAQDSRRF